ncbi:MAG: Mrp/NBP35 family ATP-binding protein [Clostridia bacterium]|nr:Mrp/NBP35 family ATP-binding protein [Clostridia bacterium]
MGECTHNCSTCSSSDCKDRKNDLLAPMNSESNIKKVYAVVSGKGGVGKSMVTSLLAVAESRLGKKVAVLDADITGPSIPKAFGITELATTSDNLINPIVTSTGIKLMSMNCLLEDATGPVIWRGPVIAGAIKQFWTDVRWGDVDTMFVDCPPGTGDVPLTVFQSFPIAGIVIVTTPQDLVSMIVEKAVKMAEMMNVPIIALVENMSYMLCPDCGKKLYPFGESDLETLAKKHNIKNTFRLPIDAILRQHVDTGLIEFYKGIKADDIVKILN